MEKNECCIDVNNETANGTLSVFGEISLVQIWSLSMLFFWIGVVGVVGNLAVIYAVLMDVKMRMSMTNILIVNLAFSDLFILLFGVPEIVQFMINRGWLLGSLWCRLERGVLVASLYVSVMTLVALCVER